MHPPTSAELSIAHSTQLAHGITTRTDPQTTADTVSHQRNNATRIGSHRPTTRRRDTYMQKKRANTCSTARNKTGKHTTTPDTTHTRRGTSKTEPPVARLGRISFRGRRLSILHHVGRLRTLLQYRGGRCGRRSYRRRRIKCTGGKVAGAAAARKLLANRGEASSTCGVCSFEGECGQ